ncbi:hypothetical protein IDH21_05825 [Pelagibacterales bacterium SAG-MED47]|nr:hypothetical protein [Pelagibacterales bacterium SAG-MED47]
MIEKKIQNFIYLLFFLIIFCLHFYQLLTQHWSAVLDQDLIIIYNSILLNSGIEQEYRDHPAYTTFLINSLIYKFLNIFLATSGHIDEILNSNNINEKFQLYFYFSRTLNFFFNVVLVLFLNKILKKLDIARDLRFFLCLVFVLSFGYISSFFFIRSENLSLLFLFFSINAVLSKNTDLLFNFFIAGIFFSFSMLTKIQIIFLVPYLIYLIPKINKKYELPETKNFYLKNYLLASFFLGIICFIIFQIYIQEFPRFQTNKYIDLIVFTLGLIIFLIYFHFSGNFKKNLILFSSMLNGFVFLIIFLFLLDRINILQINDFILLRLTNPIHYMTEFTGNLAGGTVNLDYIFENIFQFFSSYNFSFVELFLLFLLFLINFRNKNYFFVLFSIFILNVLVMNFRYSDLYHIFYIFIYLILFSELTKKIDPKLSTKFSYLLLIIFFSNSLNFFIFKENNFLDSIYNRGNGMLKVCNEFKFNIIPPTYENVQYIKYWHSKIDDDKIEKICNEIN